MTDFPTTARDERLAMFPIECPDIWKLYEDALMSFWHHKELKMDGDRADYAQRLSEGDRRYVNYILSFFAIADELVNANIIERFRKEIPYKEARAFYDHQVAVETIHNTSYSLMLDALVGDAATRARLFDAAREIPAIGGLTNYIRACANSDESIACRLLRMVCVEGIMFQGAFCAIFWYGSRGLMKGLVQANSFIARDEALHTEFSVLMYRKSRNHPSADKIKAIFDEAVSIACSFACDALPNAMECMNAELMTSYIKYVADGLAARVGSVPLYGEKNPFPFMEQINMQRQGNFFETRTTEYTRAVAGGSSKYCDV